jgi:hypothetical protein
MPEGPSDEGAWVIGLLFLLFVYWRASRGASFLSSQAYGTGAGTTPFAPLSALNAVLAPQSTGGCCS